MRRIFLCFLLCALFLLLALLEPARESEIAVVGNPERLQERYESWKSAVERQNPGHALALDLRRLPGLSGAPDGARGSVVIDFDQQTIAARLSGFDQDTPLELWLVDTRAEDPGIVPASGDRTLRVGRFQREGDELALNAPLMPRLSTGFVLDLTIVTREGGTPLEQGRLWGAPTLYQRLYAMERGLTRPAAPGLRLAGFTAFASETPTGFPALFNDLVTLGEDVFFNETFDGNGRTCGTCHPAENNFTIDADFIRALPDDDPLFVAEYVPALIFGDPANLDAAGNPRRFENPALMRAYGLIVENQDGMGDLENRFTMRSVPHNIGMTVSIETPPGGLTPPEHRTGWSGEGAPFGVVGGLVTFGTLRDFALGAIIQHFAKTMERSFSGPSPDFRLPTATELDAMEAFMLSIGRQTELELREGFPNTLTLKDPDAQAGLELFRDGSPPGTFTCNNCHFNAGANVEGAGNRNFNTGVEAFLQSRIDDPDFTVVGEPRPVDGGFGLNPAGDFATLEPQSGFVNENFGDQTFNTVSLVEAADTPPFFHNNVIDDLEESIRFYNSVEFLAATGGSIPFDSSEVTEVAQFLRVINAIDNLENFTLRYAAKAIRGLRQNAIDDRVINRLLSLAVADLEDAEEVLTEGDLHRDARKELKRAKKRFEQAMNTHPPVFVRVGHIERGMDEVSDALGEMR